MFGRYPVRHCDQSSLLDIVSENSLLSRRNMSCLIFLQKIVTGQIYSQTLLNEIKFNVPRLGSRIQISFSYNIPNTLHHFNSPLIACIRLYNYIISRDQNIDIFFNNFCNVGIRNKILKIVVAVL